MRGDTLHVVTGVIWLQTGAKGARNTDGGIGLFDYRHFLRAVDQVRVGANLRYRRDHFRGQPFAGKAAKTSQTAPQQEAPEEPEQAEAMQDKETQYQTEEKGIYCSYVCLGAARKAFVRSGCENKAKATAWSVLSSIASAARKQNDGSYVSEVCQAKIADEWGMNRRTVIRQMKILVELGLIEPYGEYVIGQHARKYRMLFQVENAR